MTFLALLFAHLLADYPLQGDFLANMKGKRILLMLTHCGIWTGCICMAAHFCGITFGTASVWWLFMIHLAADEFKAQGYYGKSDPLGWPLWCDQGIHVLQIIGLLVTR